MRHNLRLYFGRSFFRKFAQKGQAFRSHRAPLGNFVKSFAFFSFLLRKKISTSILNALIYFFHIFKYSFFYYIIIFFTSCSIYKPCTEPLIIKEKYKKINIEKYNLDYEAYINDYEFTIFSLLNKNSDDYDLFYAKIITCLLKTKEKPNYLFEQKNYKYKFNRFSKKPIIKKFKDNHKNYFKYIPITSDSLAGKLQEYYQKYDSVLIGKHFWFEYKNDNMILSKTINYDKIYPICWNKAIKLAKKQGIKDKFPKLIPPEYYPEVNKNNNKDNVFWIVSDNNKTIKINAYTGKKL